jgi:hypothetical protein
MTMPYAKSLSGASFTEQTNDQNGIEIEFYKRLTEGFTETDATEVYNQMNATPGIRRQYDMDQYVRYPRSHPEYLPDAKEKLLNDSNQVLNRQYMTMIMTITATASLGIIAFMVTASSPQ